MITEYKMVVAPNAAQLTELVTTAMASGWKPFGNPVVQTLGEGKFFQAVVKYAA